MTVEILGYIAEPIIEKPKKKKRTRVKAITQGIILSGISILAFITGAIEASIIFAVMALVLLFGEEEK